MIHLLETVQGNGGGGGGGGGALIDKLRPEHIKMHLNLYILTHRFLVDNRLDKLTLKDLVDYKLINSDGGGASSSSSALLSTTVPNSLNELFQPYLLEYIREQEDQFIKYIHKIYDMDRINCLADEMSSLISKNNKQNSLTMSFSFHALESHRSPQQQPHSKRSPTGMRCSSGIAAAAVESGINETTTTTSIYRLENYYSPSITDLFTIIHELLQTILQFDSENSELNLPHQLCFVNLIKNKLLTYSAHIKKEYHKVCKSDSSSYEWYGILIFYAFVVVVVDLFFSLICFCLIIIQQAKFRFDQLKAKPQANHSLLHIDKQLSKEH
jgi:hypothetical protein